MSTYRLQQLFDPQSIVIVGVGARPTSVGRVILKNLQSARFAGKIWLVDLHAEIEGIKVFRDFQALPETPDLAILAAPAPAIPEIVEAAGRKGIGAAIIVTAGLGHGRGSLLELAAAKARRFGMRILGPNCIGLLNPAARLNASFSAQMPPAGDIALISQSGAVAAGIIAWGTQRKIGFSAVASIGDMADVDVGDLLDYFALDPATRSILTYIESVKDVRKFMSAARAAARVKPIIAIKSGRHKQAAVAAATHTGALAGSDAVYDAALERAGILRVFDLDEFFDAAETLARTQPFSGDRLAILTNGGGVGVMAVDRLNDYNGKLARLSDAAKSQLDAYLPAIWSRSNPVDIVGDADADRYELALKALLADSENDAVLVLQVPTALSLPVETARRVSEVVKKSRNTARPKPVFCAWVGENPETADIFAESKIPHFLTESEAIRGFMHLVRYQKAQEALSKVPPSLPNDFSPDRASAHAIIRKAVEEKRKWLDPDEIEALFGAYRIPILPVTIAGTPEQAGRAAAVLFKTYKAVVAKIFSRDIFHKSDVGGVELNLRDEEAVHNTAAMLLERAKKARPDAVIKGVILQPMVKKPNGRELIAGIATDPTFGPVVLFGRGGTAVEVINDKALGLPPLDLGLAQRLIDKTRVARRLKAYRNIPAADESAIALTLVKLSQMAADFAEISEVDINPLVADEEGVIALDARVAVSPQAKSAPTNPNFAIKPYPSEWEREAEFGDRKRIFIRPIRPEDESLLRKFLEKISAEDLCLRFFAPVKDFSSAFIARLTQIDYNRAIALIALDAERREILGVVRLHIDTNFEAGEYAVLVRSDLKGLGLGRLLMQLIIEYARSVRLQRIEGEVLSGNTSMLKMCEELGFKISTSPDDMSIKLVKLSL
jgi:acetyltransferase